ncbi:glutathione S-transferase T3 [Setaria italica]|uniref:glutathione S-transferase T3 n=1 Tax=Setaria italica TaxID=4555 RepID=UPI000351336D|nr:glutathione S-transferase T3 [Setaria italica]
MALQARRAAAPQGASPSPAQASKATPDSIATNPTWLSMPPAFVPNCSSPMVNSDLNATYAELGSHPPGGFLSYFEPSDYSHPKEVPRETPMSPNFVYASGPTPYAPFQTPQPWMAEGWTSQSAPKQVTTHSSLGSQAAPVVDVENIDDNGVNPSTLSKKDAGGSRTERRMIWTSDETMRLVSAWLKNSNDPIKGNRKRNDQYWGALTSMFNSTTPSDRIREVKQLKEQWHRVNRTANAFQGSWIKVQRLRASGESDEQVMDKAMAFYEEDFEEGQFKLIACWKALRDQPKWHAYNEDLNESNKRKNSESEAVDLTSSPDVLNGLPRPIGCKKAKDESKGKGKGKGSSSTLDEIDKLREGQAKSKEDRIEVLERHQQIAADKKESARLNHLAAREKKEAKLLEKEGKLRDKESKLLETYKSLLTFDTRHMLEDLKAEHMIAAKSMRERIFANFAS